jgi:MFS family permease
MGHLSLDRATDLPLPRSAGVRYTIILTTSLAAVLLYLDRVCISIAGIYIQEDLRLSEVQMGWVFSAFFWAYGVGQVPAGWFGDRFGPRRMMTLYILAWSAFTALTSAATGLAALLAARFAFGLAQAGAYPTAASLLRRWVPVAGRGLAGGLVSLGGRIGGAIAPLLTALMLVVLVPSNHSSLLMAGDIPDAAKLIAVLDLPQKPFAEELSRRLRLLWPAGKVPSSATSKELAERLNVALGDRNLTEGIVLPDEALPREARTLLRLPLADRTPAQAERLNRLGLEAAFPGCLRRVYGDGWRPLLVIYGLAGLGLALLFWLIVRDEPARHPWSNAAEARLVSADSATRATPPPSAPPWKALLKSGNQWLSSASQFFICVSWTFVITLMPLYLAEAFAVPNEELGAMASVPILVGCVGMLVGGSLTDILTRRLGVRWGRALPWSLPCLFGSAAFLVCLGRIGPWGIVAAMSGMTIATDLTVAPCWAFSQDTGGRNTGSVLGWSNMWGNLGSAVSPLVLTAIKAFAGWSAVFVLCAVCFSLAGLSALLLDAGRKLDAEPSALVSGSAQVGGCA